MFLLTIPGPADIPPVLITPFALLLVLIAAMPLTSRLKQWWERFYPLVALGLGAMVVIYYLTAIPGGAEELAHTATDYLAFICLLGSLFVVAGGIHLKITGETTPLANVAFLALGAVIANVIGTTGASMVLIRPWIRMNKIRSSAYHVVFFIFIVSNIGGALTPIGDPPLFLGYLRGVPFFWLVPHVMLPWLVTIAAILGVFYAFDARSFKRMPRQLRTGVTTHTETWRLDGAVNVLLLFAIIGAVFLPDTNFLREGVMLAAAVVSLVVTPPEVHAENSFSFGPIKEVALLFIGIFATMLPALDYLARHGQAFHLVQPLQYYFACGALSAVLDNAPTYAGFFQLAQTTASAQLPATFAAAPAAVAGTTSVLLATRPLYVIGISLGAVFFGAMTYIGNGPNFMVKSIAHDAGVHCPTFLGYIFKYSLPILLPILALSGWLFI
jgi:Na+/H+ antiporter NhaD/arsenite permease-like protein